jgi:uncharacterized protein YceK
MFMKRVLSLFSMLFMGGLIVFSAMLQSGCEEAKGLDGLQVDPSSTTLTTNDQTVIFTVTGGITNEALALPLTWRVQDGSLGNIIHSSGYTAIYQRSDNDGVNTIIVRDQYENEGYATVQQRSDNYSLTLDASDSSVTVNEGVTITVTTAEAEAPFSWQLISGPGSVDESVGASAGFSSSTAGVAVIRATDANGAAGVVTITILDSDGTDDGSSGGPGGTDP